MLYLESIGELDFYSFANCLLQRVYYNMDYCIFRWLVAKDSYVAYMNKDRTTIRAVMLYDGDFKVNTGKLETKIKNGVMISNLQR